MAEVSRKDIAERRPGLWDYTADVVIVGYGGAGVAAAIEAHDAGASVLVLEKAPTPDGGNSGVSGGISQIPTPLEDFVKYMKLITWGTVNDDSLIEATCREITELPNWVESLGGKTIMTSFKLDVPSTLVNGLLSPQFSGFKDSQPIMLFAKSDGTWGHGSFFISFLQKCAADRKIRVMCSTPVKELVQNPLTREIIGVKASDSSGRDLHVKARRGVILACGGYENNPEMIRQFSNIPHSGFITFYGTPYNTGDGVVMAQSVGAKLWHMNKTEIHALASKVASEEIGCGIVIDAAYGMPWGDELPAIIVNRYGKRFMNEHFYSGHNSRTREYDYFEELHSRVDQIDFCDYPNIPFYIVFDSVMMKTGSLTHPYRYAGETTPTHEASYRWSEDNSAELSKGWIVSADTPYELGKKVICKDYFGRVVGMDAAGLEDTIKNYNENCKGGKDPDFHRNPRTLRPLVSPPFYAIELCECQTNTDGGPVRDQFMRTIDVYGKPIPRLYSTGELGSFFGFLYYGGGNFPEALATGRIAGRHAASLTACE